MDVLTEILFEAELFDEVENILAREGTVMEEDQFIRLDLSKLGLTELPEIINSLKGIELLDLRFNKLRDFPEQIMELNETEILLDGNPVYSVEMMADNLKGRSKENDEKRAGDKIYYSQKECYWCGREAGYRKEEGYVSGVWGGTKHYIRMLICLSCGHIEYFYQTRSII